MPMCEVPFCTSKKGEAAKKLGITFHEFPSNLELREKWIVAISRKDPDSNGYWVPNCRSVVCSLHFTSESFKCTPKRKVLFPASIPSIFFGNSVYMQTGNSPAKCCRLVRVNKQIPPSSHNGTEPELVSETEVTTCNENSLLEDLAAVHQNRMLDITSKCITSVPSIPSTNTEMKYQQLKTVYTQDQNSPAKVHIVRVNKQIPSSSPNATEQKLVSETEPTICNENLLLEDLAEVHRTLDINSKHAKSVSSISSTATEMKCEELKTRCKRLKTRFDTESRKNRRLNVKMRKLEEELETLRDNNKSLDNRMSQYNIDYLEEFIKNEDTKALFLKDQLLSLSKKKMVWSDCTFKNTVLLRSKSSTAYHFLRRMNILSLPSISSLSRYVKKCNKDVVDPLNDLGNNLPVIDKRDMWFT